MFWNIHILELTHICEGWWKGMLVSRVIKISLQAALPPTFNK